MLVLCAVATSLVELFTTKQVEIYFRQDEILLTNSLDELDKVRCKFLRYQIYNS